MNPTNTTTQPLAPTPDEPPTAEAAPPKLITVEQAVPLAKSMLWQINRQFYEQQGVEAWNQRVPFQVTSNPSIAHAYAQMVIRFMQDYQKGPSFKAGEPFYILELGAGHGRLSYYMVKHLLALRQRLQLQHVQFVYVITDLAPKNIAWCEQHEAMANYQAQGLVDYAVYNVEEPAQIQLKNSGRVIDPQQATLNPIIVLANYVFDSLSQSLFKYANGQWHTALATIATYDTHMANGLPTDPEQLQLTYTYQPVAPQEQPTVLQALLQQYEKQYSSGYFLVPVGALNCIAHLMGCAANRLFLLATDKGMNRSNELIDQTEYVSGGFYNASMLVNFKVLDDYFQSVGGQAYHQPTEQSVLTSAFVQGVPPGQLPETQQAIDTHIGISGPGNNYSLLTHLINTNSYCSFETLMAQFWASHWDPFVFQTMLGTILNNMQQPAPNARADLMAAMQKIGNNFYYMPGAPDTFYSIALVMQYLSAFTEAIDYYNQSMAWYPATPFVWYNIGLCHHALQNPEAAIVAFEKAIALDSNFVAARGWLGQIQAELASANLAQ